MIKTMEFVYATKYALTDGILHDEAEIVEGMAVMRHRGFYFHGEGREWHRTEEAAKARAEEMRIKKISSHQKAIKKLENLKF